ncbi:MAG: DUF4157 domain-containing protein, partial [Pyrinomonadaceae bacterium]
MFATKGKESSETKAGARAGRAQPRPTSAEPAVVAPVNPLWQHLATRLQAKLAVGPPDDPYEREADRVAEQVMRMPDGVAVNRVAVGDTLRRKCSCGGAGVDCEECKTSQEAVVVQRVATHDSASSSGGGVPPVVNRVLSSSGQPLSPSTRAFFEPRFGHDLSTVRVHTDAAAAESARSVNALAYAVGHDVVFDTGRYASETTEGRKLLAHELTHVLQQSGLGASPARRIQRTPRTLPTHVDPTNILLYPVRGAPNVRVGRLAHTRGGLESDTTLRGRVSAIIGEGATLRGIARTLLPMYVTAAVAGAPAAPTEEELAKGLLEYGRRYLIRLQAGAPVLAGWRAGLRFPLPIELDPDPGPESHLRRDWIVDPDDVRARAGRI